MSAKVLQLREGLSKIATKEGRKAGLVDFIPQPNDIVIVTPGKCGTTLLCQMCHSLRSGGDLNFEEINMVIPCFEMAVDAGVVIDAPQLSQPRLFKTHAWWHYCPKGPGVKHIYMVRNLEPAAISLYNFIGNGWYFDNKDLDLDTFVQEFVLGRGAPQTIFENASFWHNIASWYPQRNEENVLWLFYEDVVKDKEAYVKHIADFMGIELSEELLNITLEQSSKEFMAAHADKYDEHMLKLARNEACGLPKLAGLHEHSVGKVRIGSRENDVLSSETLQKMDQRWQEVVFPVTGCRNYDELREQVNKELGRST